MLKPTTEQLKFLDWEVGMFFHFGIRPFYHGHKDWDGLPMPPEGFNPTRLDCRQWLRTAKLIGAKYAILTTKHHDGFALWPSKYTGYSVAASPWKEGKGDVVKEFTEACRAEGMGIGLYYSPAQWGSSAVSFDRPEEYDDYFINQITELLTGYGRIDYLWFDGCGSGGHKYDQKRIVAAIRALQPGLLIFDMWDPDTRWVGNEDGYAPMVNLYEAEMNVVGERKRVFAPAECDCRLRESWFYDLNENTSKSVDELIGMYEMSVGRGSNLLLNIGPDDRGLIAPGDYKRISELGAEINRRYGTAHEFESVQKVQDNLYRVRLPEDRLSGIGKSDYLPLVRAAIIKEDVSEGQSVREFKLYAYLPGLDPDKAGRVCVYHGGTIGHKAIARFPALRTAGLELEIVSSEGTPRITEIKVYG